MLYMIVERFRDGNAIPVYKRFREEGRLAPKGLTYVNSWVTEDLSCCYQVMECESESLIHEWIANWDDLVSFEVFPVITSAEASARVPDNA